MCKLWSRFAPGWLAVVLFAATVSYGDEHSVSRSELFGPVPLRGAVEFFNKCDHAGRSLGDLDGNGDFESDIEATQTFYGRHFAKIDQVFPENIVTIANHPFRAARMSFEQFWRGHVVAPTTLPEEEIWDRALARTRSVYQAPATMPAAEVFRKYAGSYAYFKKKLFQIRIFDRVSREVPSRGNIEIWRRDFKQDINEVRRLNFESLRSADRIPPELKLYLTHTAANEGSKTILWGADLVAAKWEFELNGSPDAPADSERRSNHPSITKAESLTWFGAGLVSEILNTWSERFTKISFNSKSRQLRKEISDALYLPISGDIKASDLEVPITLVWSPQQIPESMRAQPRQSDGSVRLVLSAIEGGEFLIALADTHILVDTENADLMRRKTEQWHWVADVLARDTELRRLETFLNGININSAEELEASLLLREDLATRRLQEVNGELKEIVAVSDFDRVIMHGRPALKDGAWVWIRWAGYQLHVNFWEIRDRLAELVNAADILDSDAGKHPSRKFEALRTWMDQKLRSYTKGVRTAVVVSMLFLPALGTIEIINQNTPDEKTDVATATKVIRQPNAKAEIKNIRVQDAHNIQKPESSTLFTIERRTIPMKQLPDRFALPIENQARDVGKNRLKQTKFFHWTLSPGREQFFLVSKAPVVEDDLFTLPVPTAIGFEVTSVKVTDATGRVLKGDEFAIYNNPYRGLMVMALKNKVVRAGKDATAIPHLGPFQIEYGYSPAVKPAVPEVVTKPLDSTELQAHAQEAVTDGFKPFGNALRFAAQSGPVTLEKLMEIERQNTVYSYLPEKDPPPEADKIPEGSRKFYIKYQGFLLGSDGQARGQCTFSANFTRDFMTSYFASTRAKDVEALVVGGYVRVGTSIFTDGAHAFNRIASTIIPNTYVNADGTGVGEPIESHETKISAYFPEAMAVTLAMPKRLRMGFEPDGPPYEPTDIQELDRLIETLDRAVLAYIKREAEIGGHSIMRNADTADLPIQGALNLAMALRDYVTRKTEIQIFRQQLLSLLRLTPTTNLETYRREGIGRLSLSEHAIPLPVSPESEVAMLLQVGSAELLNVYRQMQKDLGLLDSTAAPRLKVLGPFVMDSKVIPASEALLGFLAVEHPRPQLPPVPEGQCQIVFRKLNFSYEGH